MTALKVLLVDDEAPARNRLRALLADCAAELPVAVAGEAASGMEALNWLANNQADVAVLDIHMPGMEGVELARHMQKLTTPPAIIFCTAFDQHAVEAFEVNAVDYLLKPVRAERLLSALRKVRVPTAAQLGGLPHQARTHLSIAERGKVVLVPVTDIAYLRAEQKYVTVRTVVREFLCEESLTHLEQEFSERFIRIHRNCLVARAFMAGFEKQVHADGEDESGGAGWVVVLRGLPEKLPISRRHRHVVRDVDNK